jgi:cysteine desulfurase family protein
MDNYPAEIGSNPWYSSHRRARRGDDVIEQARRDVAWVLGVTRPEHVVFTLNATEALNRLIQGFIGRNDRVLASRVEHASVTRPLSLLSRTGNVKVERIGDPATGIISPDDIHAALEKNPAKLLVVSHASNVTGVVQPIEDLTRAAHQHGCAVLVDSAQTAGLMPIKAEKWGVDFLAFSGHKHLLGPMGVGGFYVADPDRLKPTVVGSTGYLDSSDDIPAEMPHRFEPGTPNAPGIAGLGASCRAIREKGISEIHTNNHNLTHKIVKALKSMPGVKSYGPSDARKRVGVIAFNIDKMHPQEVGDCLDNRFEIMVRAGLCSSHWTHECLGTMPDGVVRASLGYFTKEEDVDLLIDAVGMIAADAPRPARCR